MIIGIIEPFGFEDERIYKLVSSAGFFLQAIYFSRLFWHRNTVQWNDKGIAIRIKSFPGRALGFDEIEMTELNARSLILTKTTGEVIELNLEEFSEDDTQKLNDIFVNNIISRNA